MHPFHHALSSARKFGGQPEDYQHIHNWFDESKMFFAEFRHRALRHHAEGIYMAERLFGVTITNSDGSQIPVRYIGEQHVREDLGRIPSVEDWLSKIEVEPWMRAKPQEVESDIYKMSTGRSLVETKNETIKKRNNSKGDQKGK